MLGRAYDFLKKKSIIEEAIPHDCGFSVLLIQSFSKDLQLLDLTGLGDAAEVGKVIFNVFREEEVWAGKSRVHANNI